MRIAVRPALALLARSTNANPLAQGSYSQCAGSRAQAQPFGATPTYFVGPRGDALPAPQGPEA